MEQVCPQKKCTGCAACVSACPKQAISFNPDSCGYYYPQINRSSCINCGLCRKVCPSVTLQHLDYPIDNLAVTAKKEEDVLSCASGGAATILSNTVLANGGIVYGCDGSDIRNVHHVRIDSISELWRLKGSKYVQSYTGDIYNKVKSDLKQNLKVLFIGTPCQVAGLKGFLQGKHMDLLVTADLVCHGVPSQQMLNDNIDLYTKEKGESCEVHFREKVARRANVKCDAGYRITYGWFFQNQPYVGAARNSVPFHKDPYMLGFISGLTFRPNCYECRYACIARCSDLTLSDYWGLAKDAGFDNGKGVSNILVNTKKGEELWNMAKSNAIFEQRDIVEALRGNGQLQAPSSRHSQHDRFANLYPQIGFKKAVSICSRWYLVKFWLLQVSRWFLAIVK